MTQYIHSATRAATFAFALLAVSTLASCRREVAAPSNTPVAVLSSGLATPESVIWDAAHNVWYVSNINGSPVGKDDNGYIVRVTADGALMDSTPFISGATAEVTLNAPKGMALVGDTLWVTDIDAVRGFNVLTGGVVATIEMQRYGATFLNDAAVGPDGNVYITDSGISFGADGSVSHPGKSKIFQVMGRMVHDAVDLPRESAANGLAWDTARGAWVMNGFNSQSIFTWAPGTDSVVAIGVGPGGGDGMIVLADGRLVHTSWADSSLNFFSNGTSTTWRKALPGPADLGYDSARSLIAVPLFNDNRVEFWRIPSPE